MRLVTCSMGVSLDGYVADRDGSIDWAPPPDDELFRVIVDEFRDVGVYLLGRRLHEMMRIWETWAQDPALDDARREFADMWVSLPKVVLSRTLRSVQGTARLAEGDLADEVRRWRAEPGQGDIAVGGASVARQAAELGLLDEYRLRLHPELLGGGTSLFPQQRARLELVQSRTFASGVVHARYRVLR